MSISDDMLMHLSSNSSNQSDQSWPTKIAKLEARMVSKASSNAANLPLARQSTWSSVPAAGKFGRAAEDLAAPSTSTDSYDDNGGEFLIQANTHKHLKRPEDDNSSIFEHVEEKNVTYQIVTDGMQTSLEAVETKMNIDVNSKIHGHRRASSASRRGRGSRGNDRTRIQISPPTVLLQLEGVASLLARVVGLEDDLCKSKQETSEYQNLCQQLEKELKDLEEHEQQMKPKL